MPDLANGLVDPTLGASWDGSGVRFAVFSRRAERMELCLFSEDGLTETGRIELTQDAESVWRGYIAGLRPGQLYGYRAYGAYEPLKGHRFNPNKLLLDPYALELSGPFVHNEASFGYVVGHADGDLSYDERDSAPFVPKSRVIDRSFDWGDDRSPQRPRTDIVIYELHVRGMTMRHPGVSPKRRGLFAGLASPAVIDHLVHLGVTTVELLPVTPTVTERHLAGHGLRNYWGYNPGAFFAVEPRYCADGVNEFKAMVREFHAAGIQVIVDVVFNHSGEGDELGPTLSFRGLDNASYYRLAADDGRHYFDSSGCGNTLDCRQPHVVRLIVDALRYWVSDMHVDGFRFDLATSLARDDQSYNRQAPLLAAIKQDPLISKTMLIAEPWDAGDGGYQLGNFPDGWMEWNDRYRDTVRRFWRGDKRQIPELATRLAGSSDIFARQRGPLASVNYVVAHDGFTLEDLVSYARKHNEANLEGGADGPQENYSWNCGEEGQARSDAIRRLRQRLKRNMITTLLLSQGVPMICGGDELGRTQRGNNNAYCQDNEISWIDWSAVDGDLLAFFRNVVAIRQAHVAFRRSAFFEEPRPDRDIAPDIAWLDENGRQMEQADWLDPERRCLSLLLRESMPHQGKDCWLTVLMNGSSAAVCFTLPFPRGAGSWRRLIDTARPAAAIPDAVLGGANLYTVEEWSMALFASTEQSVQGRPRDE